MNISGFSFNKLNKDTKILDFDCGDQDLNEFLFEDAKLYLESLLAVTYILEDRVNSKTVAYYCLLNDKIELDPDEKSKWNKLNRTIPNSKRYHAYPAVKIGRLGVSKEYTHQHIGENLILQIKILFARMNVSGCRFLTVDAYKEAIPFYKKCGFKFLTDKDTEDQTRSMYFDLIYYK